MDSRIRVMIVDDHEMVRNGLLILLEAFDDLCPVGMATNGEEAVQMCNEIEADVVLMDLDMPRMDGLAAIRIIRQRQPQIQFVVMISFGNEELLEEVMAAGAASYVLKSAPIDQVAGAIRAAARQSTSPRYTSPAPIRYGACGAQSKERQRSKGPNGHSPGEFIHAFDAGLLEASMP